MDTANALFNPVVLKNLFDVCALTDLRRFRLVSKLWHDVSLPRWRNEIVVHLVTDTGFDPKEGSLPHMRPHLNCANAKLLYETPSIVALPFRKFCLTHWRFADVDSDKPPNQKSDHKQKIILGRSPKLIGDAEDNKFEDLELFWEHCGPWMHHLEIFFPKIDSVKAFRKAIVVQTPNLKSLDFDWNDGQLEFDEDNFADELGSQIQPNLKVLRCSWAPPWKYLFKHFPNVQEIDWGITDEGACRKFVNWLEEWSKENGPRRKLIFSCDPHIIIRDYDRHKEYADAIKHILPLKQLKFKHIGLFVNGDGGKTETYLFSKFMDLHTETLESVYGSVIQDPVTEIWKQQSPFQVARPLLRKLKLDSTDFIPNLQLLQNTQNLRELKISEDNLGLRELLGRSNGGGFVLEKLERFEIKHYSFSEDEDSSPLSESEMQIIVKFAPNLKWFIGPVNNASFRVICQSWRDLRKLATYSNQLNDEGITGIVPGEGGIERLPNITDLKYLQQFWTDEQEDPPLLSDTSIWNGFLQLEYLQSLKIQMSVQTSNRAFSALFAKFPSIHVVRSDGTEGNQYGRDITRLNEKFMKKAEQLAKEYDIGIDDSDLNL